MNKSAIVLISNASGGIATYQSNLIKFYIKSKYKIILLDKKLNSHTYKNLNNYEKRNILAFNANVLWEPIKTFKILNKININFSNITYIINNPTVYAIYTLFIKILLKKNKIYLIMHSHLLKNSFFQIVSSLICSMLSFYSKKVIFVSNFTKIWWHKRFPLFKLSKSTVQYNLINNFKIKKNKSKKYRIGFVGRLANEKGVENFIKISDSMKNNKKFLFFIYGNGEKKNLLINKKNIIFKGWDFKKKFLKSLDLLLITSPIENCPYSVLECKANGIPTLNLARGGIVEIIKHRSDGINLSPSSNLKKIRNNINFIKKNQIKFKKNCLINVKKFYLKKSFLL